MAACSCNPNFDSIGSNPESNLRNSRTLANVVTPYQNSEMARNSTDISVTKRLQNLAAQAFKEVAPGAPKAVEIEEKP